VWCIGVLTAYIEGNPVKQPNVEAFVQGLGDLGWNDGRKGPRIARRVLIRPSGHQCLVASSSSRNAPQGVFTLNFPIRRKASLNAAGTPSKLPVPVALAYAPVPDTIV
jgi:hypothetical protein